MDGQSSLADWIAANTTQAKLARDLNCSESHISLILKGERTPSLRLAKRISEATGGTVPMGALLGERRTEPAQ